MAGNHLEDLVAEWYEYSGYFVRRNVQVGPRRRGGYECELDVVAFHPGTKRLLHIEPSLDSYTWAIREQRYAKKFRAGRKYIPALFKGFAVPETPVLEQMALLVYASKRTRSKLGGGSICLISEFMEEIRATLRQRRVSQAAVPEQFPLLRSLQFAANYWK
jgi:hypothetical protein